MEIIITKIFNLEPIDQKIIFRFDTKKGRAKDATYIHIGSVYIPQRWTIEEKQKRELQRLMIKSKTDVLTDGKSYYTVMGLGNHHELIEIQHPLIKK